MKAIIYHEFGKTPVLETVPDPIPPSQGVVLGVKATGLCLSDWHGWQGHDPDIRLPHVPGHELVGVVEAKGSEVQHWQVGDRVTLPFVGGCGSCPQCETGNHQVCDRQFQPGFTHWGSFAELVAIDYADVNLVSLPETMDDVTAASLGCRFATAYRGVVHQGALKSGQSLAVHGCGGVGLSALMIAKALGAEVLAVDINAEKLDMATNLGADHTILATNPQDVVPQIMEVSQGGVDVSMDALGHPDTAFNSIACLKKRGRHVQIGIMSTQNRNAAVPLDLIVAKELELVGSHGIQAHTYPQMLKFIQEAQIPLDKLVERTISIAEAPQELVEMAEFARTGVTVINRF
jgi:alcohol dehydrogenase